MLPPSKKRGKRDDKRCKSPQSDKSAPDAAYEFESPELSDNLGDDDIADIMEDVTVEDVEMEEDQSLFDSGFGSMKSFSVKEKQKSKDDTKSKELESGKGTIKIKPLKSPYSRHPKRKAAKFRQAAKNNVKSQNSAVEKEQNKARFESGVGCIKSRNQEDEHISYFLNSKEWEPGKEHVTKKKTLDHPTSRRSRRNAIKPHQNFKNISPRTLAGKLGSPSKAKSRKTSREKSSDVDSGKDSPKVLRTARSRRLQQRSLRKNAKSNYHTRSSGLKLLGQQEENLKFLIRKRKRRRSLRHDVTDDEEEIKKAAGSLMRLAGFLLNSPKSTNSLESK